MAIYQRGDNWYVDFYFHGQRIREMIGPPRRGAEKIISKKKAEFAENKFLDIRKDSDASNLAMAVVELNDIRDLVGHNSITMTLRYAHLSPAHKSRR